VYARYNYSFTEPNSIQGNNDAYQHIQDVYVAWASELRNNDDPNGRWELDVPVYDETYADDIHITYTPSAAN
jgi:hypothetical protein